MFPCDLALNMTQNHMASWQKFFIAATALFKPALGV